MTNKALNWRVENILKRLESIKESLDVVNSTIKQLSLLNTLIPEITNEIDAISALASEIAQILSETQAISDKKQTQKQSQQQKENKIPYDEWRKFFAKVNQLGLRNEDLKQLLGVNSIKELTSQYNLDQIYDIIVEKLQQEVNSETVKKNFAGKDIKLSDEGE